MRNKIVGILASIAFISVNCVATQKNTYNFTNLGLSIEALKSCTVRGQNISKTDQETSLADLNFTPAQSKNEVLVIAGSILGAKNSEERVDILINWQAKKSLTFNVHDKTLTFKRLTNLDSDTGFESHNSLSYDICSAMEKFPQSSETFSLLLDLTTQIPNTEKAMSAVNTILQEIVKYNASSKSKQPL